MGNGPGKTPGVLGRYRYISFAAKLRGETRSVLRLTESSSDAGRFTSGSEKGEIGFRRGFIHIRTFIYNTYMYVKRYTHLSTVTPR